MSISYITDNFKIVKQALRYEKCGFNVIPLKKGDKRPLIDWKLHQQTRANEELVRSWWARWPDANIGIVTGAISGIIALDIDGPEGEESIKRYKLAIPPTPAVRTGGGGLHYFFKHPGYPCRNFTKRYPGIDFRGDGGYVVAPPSLHKSGKNYEWLIPPWHEELAGPPAWLIELVEIQETSGRLEPDEWASDIPQGQRNEEITRRAGSLLARGIPPGEVFTMLLAVNSEHCKPPLPEGEVKTIVESIAEREARKQIAQKPQAENQKNTEQVDPGWPDPKPLESPLPKVEKLPVSYIPEPLQGWLKDTAWRMQCPLDFVAVGAVVAAGSVIGAGCGIRPKQHDDWLVVPNLWGGVVARPSMLKTPALKEAMRHIDRLEAEAREEHESELRFAEADIEVLKACKEAIKKEMGKSAKGTIGAKSMDVLRAEYAALEEPEQPTRRRYKSNDVTVEMLSVLLNENPRGILIFRDELIGLLVSWDKPGREADRAFFLESWDGTGNFITDRIGRGTIDTQNLCVSILGGIQPAKLAAYLSQAKDPLQNDGLIQRFQLLVYPDEPEWQLIDEAPDLDARNRAYEVYKTLADMNFLEYGATPGKKQPYFVFSEEAQKSFNAWLTELQTIKLKNETPLMAEHLSKYRSLMPSLALIFHLIDCADNGTSGPISNEVAIRAVAWCEYLESHARRIYSFVADTDEQAAVELTKRLKEKALEDGFSLRDLYRKHWSLLDTKEAAEAACNVLVEANWLREIKEEIPGRQPKVVYQINPKIFK